MRLVLILLGAAVALGLAVFLSMDAGPGPPNPAATPGSGTIPGGPPPDSRLRFLRDTSPVDPIVVGDGERLSWVVAGDPEKEIGPEIQSTKLRLVLVVDARQVADPELRQRMLARGTTTELSVAARVRAGMRVVLTSEPVESSGREPDTRVEIAIEGGTRVRRSAVLLPRTLGSDEWRELVEGFEVSLESPALIGLHRGQEVRLHWVPGS